MLKFVETYGLLLLILLWLGNFHRQMKHFKGTSMLLILKLAFSRVVREILGELYIGQGLRIQGSALEALQEATEAILVNELASWFCHAIVLTNVLIFELVSSLAAIHAKRAVREQPKLVSRAQARR